MEKPIDENKFVKAFREGAKRAYGKIFWRWLDARRGEQTPNRYCLEFLGVQPSTYSRGMSEGRFCLENMIYLLLQTGATIRKDAPELPDKRVLQTLGFQNALATCKKTNAQVVELIYAQFLVMGVKKHPEVAHWVLLKQRQKEARTENERRMWRQELKFFEQAIAQKVRPLIETYYNTFPDERPSSSSYLRDCSLVWDSCGDAVKECELSLYAFRWIGLDG